jgi:prepilin-type processing-associated H-X9-DG protein
MRRSSILILLLIASGLAFAFTASEGDGWGSLVYPAIIFVPIVFLVVVVTFIRMMVRASSFSFGNKLIITIALLLCIYALPREIGMLQHSRVAMGSRQVVCENSLATLADGIKQYRLKHNDTLPVGNEWCTAIAPFIENPENFRCLNDNRLKDPYRGSKYCSYAFNAKLSGKSYSTLTDPAHTVMLFESERGWNASGGVEMLPKEPRHSGADNYVFADGHTEAISRKDAARVRY